MPCPAPEPPTSPRHMALASSMPMDRCNPGPGQPMSETECKPPAVLDAADEAAVRGQQMAAQRQVLGVPGLTTALSACQQARPTLYVQCGAFNSRPGHRSVLTQVLGMAVVVGLAGCDRPAPEPANGTPQPAHNAAATPSSSPAAAPGWTFNIHACPRKQEFFGLLEHTRCGPGALPNGTLRMRQSHPEGGPCELVVADGKVSLNVRAGAASARLDAGPGDQLSVAPEGTTMKVTDQGGNSGAWQLSLSFDPTGQLNAVMGAAGDNSVVCFVVR